jgi:tetratricopeptide (TPR) repeat protein
LTGLPTETGITESQRTAAKGEAATVIVLEDFAQVLHSARLLEYALDFYCRLLSQNKPSNKAFWVEVKTPIHFTDKWRRPIDREIIEFWLIQTSPVFVIICDLANNSFYWISVEDNRDTWSKKLQKNVKTIFIRVDKSHVFKKGDQNINFIKKIEEDIIRLNAQIGIPQFISKGRGGPNGYIHGYIPILKLSDNARKSISGRIRFGFNYLIYDSILRNNLQEAYKLCKILTSFDTSHYDHFRLMARICRQLEKYDEARTYYDTAIKMCKEDPNWDKNRIEGIPYISEIISELEKEKASLPKNQK